MDHETEVRFHQIHEGEKNVILEQNFSKRNKTVQNFPARKTIIYNGKK